MNSSKWIPCEFHSVSVGAVKGGGIVAQESRELNGSWVADTLVLQWIWCRCRFLQDYKGEAYVIQQDLFCEWSYSAPCSPKSSAAAESTVSLKNPTSSPSCYLSIHIVLSMCVWLHQESSGIEIPYVCPSSFLYLWDTECDVNNGPYLMHNATSNAVFSANPPTCILHALWERLRTSCSDHRTWA